MFYVNVSLAYVVVNILLSVIVLIKSGKNVIGKFYSFCVGSIVAFGLSVFFLETFPDAPINPVLNIAVDFLFSLIPFFFLHFIVIFLRRYELLKAKWLIYAIYFVGLFSYFTVVAGLLPDPIRTNGEASHIEYIYFITWMSVFFSIGIAILFTHIRVFAEPKTKSSLLFSGFTILLLLLPSPFTYSLSLFFAADNVEWYGVTSILALIVSVYLLFRHKILVTLYDSVKSALLVMDDLFFMTDQDFNIEVARGALSPMLGYSEKDMLGKNLNDFLSQKEYITSYLEYVSKGKMRECRFDTDVNTKDGSAVTINFSFSPVIENEQIAGFVGIGRDITERKKNELELRQSREQYRELVENIHEAYYVTNAEGMLTYVSPNVSSLTGYPAEELQYNSFVRLIAKKDRRRIVDFFEMKIDQGIVDTECEFSLQRKDGSIIWIEQRTRIIRDETGKLIEFRNIAHDITERKKTDEQIRLLAQALETTSELVWISDASNNIIHVNKAFERTFGYTQDEIYTRHPILLFSLREQEIVLEEIFSPQATEGWSGEVTCSKKNGAEFTSLLSTSTIKNNDGEPIGYIGVARDISDYKSMEEQLRQSQKLEGIGTLAGGIAHDFNNILTIILSYNSVLSRNKLTPERHTEAVQMIRSAVERGAGIVRQLLTIARKTPVEFAPVSINTTIKELTNFLSETFSKLIILETELDAKLPEIIADQNQLQQVFLNLCVNARDAMPDGGSLKLKTSVVSDTELKEKHPDIQYANYIKISVTDTGSGMTEEVQTKIFEPFYTTKERGKGTGLGLAVVYSVIHSHHGFIDLESEVGKGTTFHVYLPVVHEINGQKEPDSEILERYLTGKETILLVEDEEALLSLVRSELEGQGYQVLVARDGLEALRVFAANKEAIDVVVSDLGLPKLGGWESYLKMREINSEVKAILASGYIEPKLQSAMSKAGVKGYIHKPYHVDDLMDKIRKMLDETN